MKPRSHQRRRPIPAAIACTATVVALLGAAFPGLASASVVSLSIDPLAPKKNEPFTLFANGTSLAPVTSPDGNVVELGYAVGGGLCPPTAAEAFPPDARGTDSVVRPVADGDFRTEYYIPGVHGGRLRVCGYVYAAKGPPFRSDPPLAFHGFDFALAETCESATRRLKQARNRLARAKRKLARAKRQLRKAKRTGSKAQIRKARAKVRKTRRKVRRSRRAVRNAREDREHACQEGARG